MTGIRFPLFTAGVAALAMALTVPASAGPIYKWVDSQGVTHYGEKAPDGTQTSKVNVSDTTSSDAEDEIRQLNERRTADSKKEQDAAGSKPAAPAQSADDKAKTDSVCDQHRKNLEALKSGKRVRALGDDGKPRILGDDEINKQIEFAQQELQRCEQLQQLQNNTNKAPVAPTR